MAALRSVPPGQPNLTSWGRALDGRTPRPAHLGSGPPPNRRAAEEGAPRREPVSYTHLTLPTILLV
eukprot:7322210-Pyramimonas_sp.AAC.1